jgi:hypothetical protein
MHRGSSISFSAFLRNPNAPLRNSSALQKISQLAKKKREVR